MEMNDTGHILGDEPKPGVVSSKVMLPLGVFAIVLASVALIVALISVTQKSGVSYILLPGQDGSKSEDDRIWTIAIGHMTNNNVYIDEPSGQLKGFHVDMVNAVCRVANKNCRLIYDIWQRCWDSEAGEVQRGGEGLLGGWYDACAGWVKTYPRTRTFKFAKKWQNPAKLYFIVRTGSNFNPTDVTGKTFGFVDGFYNDEFCLARQTDIRGSTLSTLQIRHYPLPDDVINAIISGEVDATIDYKKSNLPSSLTRLEDVEIDCSIDGSGGGLMFRMDNSMVNWWDPAQDRLMQTSEYREICQDIREEHGHMPGRSPEEICIGL